MIAYSVSEFHRASDGCLNDANGEQLADRERCLTLMGTKASNVGAISP